MTYIYDDERKILNEVLCYLLWYSEAWTFWVYVWSWGQMLLLDRFDHIIWCQREGSFHSPTAYTTAVTLGMSIKFVLCNRLRWLSQQQPVSSILTCSAWRQGSSQFKENPVYIVYRIWTKTIFFYPHVYHVQLCSEFIILSRNGLIHLVGVF